MSCSGQPVAAAEPPSAGFEISAPGLDGPLKGTWLGPSQDAPVILIIPGSGPTDRDGNSPLGVEASTYRLLAEGLSTRGIASVRIDKRGMFGSAAAGIDPNAVTIDDYVKDTFDWITAVSRKNGPACVWLLGHSEGGLITLAATAKSQHRICGIILISTAGRSMAQVLKDQLHANPANAPLLSAADEAIDRLSAGLSVDAANLPPPLDKIFNPSVQAFEKSEFSLDPRKLIREINVPILILQGDRDLQVRPSDAHSLKAANPAARVVIIKNSNHLLKDVSSDDLKKNISTYQNPDLPLSYGIVDAITSFVKR
jgi:pimeloyl-ACP methyl ester carboxylesterase